MAEAAAFYILAALILGFGVLVITAKSAVHSILFLVADFLCVAALYVLLQAQFLAVIQVLVYAGGIMVLYLFVVMLVNLKRPPEAHSDPRRLGFLGLLMSVAVLVELALVLRGRLDEAGRGAEAAPSARTTSADRPGPLHRLPDPLRAGVDPAAGRDDRRHHPGQAGAVGR